MSSIIIIQKTDAVHLITDGAFYDAEGRVVDVRSKVVELARSGCLMAVRGANYPSMPLEFLLGMQPNFDAIMTALPDTLRSILQMFDIVTDGDALCVERHFEVTIAGWSDERQAWTAGIASTFRPCDPEDVQGISHLDGYEPFMPLLAASACCMPAVDGVGILGRTFNRQEDVDGLDPVKDGLLLHEAQRLVVGVTGDGQIQYLVGGLAELVTVSAAGITRQLLRRWPDQIGELITPEGAEPVEDVKARLTEQMAA